jgi:hypothetical protein
LWIWSVDSPTLHAIRADSGDAPIALTAPARAAVSASAACEMRLMERETGIEPATFSLEG